MLPRPQHFKSWNAWAEELVRAMAPEKAPRMLAALLEQGTGITLSYNPGKNTITIEAVSSGGLADGDYGDVVVSGSGTALTIDAGVVDTANLGGDITTAGKALLDDADAAAQRTTLGLPTTPVMCKAVRTTNLAASVWTLVGWDEEVFDDASIHDNVTNNSRLVVPSGYTRARLLFYVIWTNVAGGARYLQIRKNAAGVSGGGTSIAVAINSSVNEAGQVLDTGWLPVVAGDYFEAFAAETAAGAPLLVGPDAGFGGRSFLQIELANAP